MNTKFGQHLFKKFNNICNTKQLYQNYLEELNDYGIEKFTDELYMSNILTDTKISSDNNFFMKVVKKIIPYPNLLVTVGMDKYNDQYQIFDNLPCNNENYLSNDEQHLGKVSMSKFHKFICPKLQISNFQHTRDKSISFLLIFRLWQQFCFYLNQTL